MRSQLNLGRLSMMTAAILSLIALETWPVAGLRTAKPAFAQDAIAPAPQASDIAPPFATVRRYRTTIADDPAIIFYPVFDAAEHPHLQLPSALVLPGALVNYRHYSAFARHVAKYGFVVILPRHVRSVPEFGVTGELSEAAQVTATVDFLATENDNPKSPLHNRLNVDQLALLGHSHGGFVGLMAIANVCLYPFCINDFSRPDAISAGVFYGVNTYNPTTNDYSSVANDHIPVAIIQGSLDGIATSNEASTTFPLIQDPPKALISVTGANHYGITNTNNPAGAMPDDNQQTLSQTQSIAAIARWTGLFLRAHLLNDAAALNYVYRSGDALDDAVNVISESVDTP